MSAASVLWSPVSQHSAFGSLLGKATPGLSYTRYLACSPALSGRASLQLVPKLLEYSYSLRVGAPSPRSFAIHRAYLTYGLRSIGMFSQCRRPHFGLDLKVFG